jgi:arginase family enzyme
MNKVAVIGVPSSSGARRTGQELAPQLFRRAGIIERLRLAGLEVIDFPSGHAQVMLSLNDRLIWRKSNRNE